MEAETELAATIPYFSEHWIRLYESIYRQRSYPHIIVLADNGLGLISKNVNVLFNPYIAHCIYLLFFVHCQLRLVLINVQMRQNTNFGL